MSDSLPANDSDDFGSGGLTIGVSPDGESIHMLAESDDGAVTTLRLSREAANQVRLTLARALSLAAELPESFADYPMSVTEAKGEFNRDSDSWTNRDALIAALRDLDANTNFRNENDEVQMTVVLQYVLNTSDDDEPHYIQSYTSQGPLVEVLGIMEMAKHDMLSQARD